MPTYSVRAINVGTFNLGEADKIITLFSAERGLIRAVAKGARKPGSKIAGRAELLAVNKLLLANGKSLDIITQAEGIESFKSLRNDLDRLSYALYYAELTCNLGQGLNQESELYFDVFLKALRQLCQAGGNYIYHCLNFQLSLLDLLGLRPELDSCVVCRKRLIESDLSVFHHELGGAICNECFSKGNVEGKGRRSVLHLAETGNNYRHNEDLSSKDTFSSHFTYLTPLVWKKLILAAANYCAPAHHNVQAEVIDKALVAARNLLETYIEHLAGKKMKALDLI